MESVFKSKTKDVLGSYKSNGEIATGITLVSALDPGKDVDISTMDMDNYFSDFLEMTYQSNDLLQKNDKLNPKDTGFFFAEKVQKHIPALIEMKFKFPNNDAGIFYDAYTIAKITKSIQSIIRDLIKFSPKDDIEETLVCFVLESKIWVDGEHQYQKLRFHFPYTCLPPTVVNGWIIPELIEDLKPLDLFKSMHTTPSVTAWEDIIMPIGNFIPMYGSKESEDVAPLFLRCVFGSILDFEISDELVDESHEEYTINYEEEDYLDPLQNYLLSVNMMNSENYYDNDKIFNLPLLLSINFKRVFNSLQQNAMILTSTIKTEKKKNETGFAALFDKNDEIFDELVKMLSPERFSPEKKYFWYDIGRIAHNIFNGSNAGLDRFKRLSHPSLKHLCDEVWETFSTEILDKRTLMQFAYEDNPDEFLAWAEESYYGKFIEPAIKAKNMSVADLACRIPRICLEFAFDREAKHWMRFKQSRLQKDSGGSELREILRYSLKEIFTKLQRQREVVRDQETIASKRKELNRQVREIDVLLDDKLDDVDFLDKVIKALKSKLFDDNLDTHKDENLNLIACTNVVLECYDKTICYRKGRLQDYVTKSTRIAFPLSYTIKTKKVRELFEYYSQVHCEPQLYYEGHDHCKYCKSTYCSEGICHGEMCEFILMDNASFLLGGNEEKRFRNLIGESNASKSQEVKLWQEAMGDYCVDFPNESITHSRTKTSGGPDPSLEQAKGSRIAVVAETDRSEPLHCGKIKKYTGNDRYWNRSLNKEGGSRCLSFKLIHMSNLIPRPLNPDEAYEGREILYMHFSKWIDNPPEDKLEQFRQRRFKKDITFTKKIKGYAQAQLWLMFTYFPIYKEKGLENIPEIVRVKTEEHQREINPYYNFIKENIEPVYLEGDNEKERDPDACIGVNKMFQTYSRWYRKFAPDSILNIDQAAFKDEMVRSNRLGKLNSHNMWAGMAFRDFSGGARSQ